MSMNSLSLKLTRELSSAASSMSDRVMAGQGSFTRGAKIASLTDFNLSRPE